MMRSLPILLLAALACVPPAQSVPIDGTQSGPAEEARHAVMRCLALGPPEECTQALERFAAYLCNGTEWGCFLCAQFTLQGDMKVDLEEILATTQVDPMGEVVLQWYGLAYRSEHDPAEPGEWQVRWNKSNEITCTDQDG